MAHVTLIYDVRNGDNIQIIPKLKISKMLGVNKMAGIYRHFIKMTKIKNLF